MQHRLPNIQESFAVDLEEVLSLTQRLNELIVQECTLLASMQLKGLHGIQEEKTQLTQRLEALQRALAADEQMVASASPDTRNRLYDAASELTGSIEENMRLTSVAQDVNRRVMQTFVEVLADQERVNVYGNQGAANATGNVTVSVNINERA